MIKRRTRIDVVVICSLLIWFSLETVIFSICLSASNVTVISSAVFFRLAPQFLRLIIVVGLSILILHEVIWTKWLLGIFAVGAGFLTIISNIRSMLLVGTIAAVASAQAFSAHEVLAVISHQILVYLPMVMGMYYIVAGIYLLVSVRKHKAAVANKRNQPL